jgi:hypothetical protein
MIRTRSEIELVSRFQLLLGCYLSISRQPLYNVAFMMKRPTNETASFDSGPPKVSAAPL